MINTLRKPSLRLDWINGAMVNAAKLGGATLIMYMGMPVIASPKFLEKIKSNALNFENYKPLEKKRWNFETCGRFIIDELVL